MVKKAAAVQKRINIVIPICLENDFIGPKGLENEKNIISLHGGKRANRRILGEADGHTPIDDVLEVAHNDEKTFFVYIEDHHKKNVDNSAHFGLFGEHCVEGTEGAKPVGRIAEFQKLRRACVVYTDALGLITHVPVVEAITSIIKEADIDDPSQVRFLVLGGLTDVLVADTAKGLNHICGIPNPYREGGDAWKFFLQVAVSDEYCFSNFGQDHDAALRSMNKVGIEILKSDADIMRFLEIQG